MGSGPPFARVPADAPNGRPRFGAYTRIYLAVAAATAAAFDPGASPDAAAILTAQAIEPEAYRGRVAADRGLLRGGRLSGGVHLARLAGAHRGQPRARRTSSAPR